MKIAIKEYYCPLCKNTTKESTNHYGEIYSGCDVCGNTILYCSESEDTFKDSELKLVHYKYDLDNIYDRDDYSELLEYLKKEGYTKYTNNISNKAMDCYKRYDCSYIGIHKPETFNHQYISEIGRVHEWFEAEYRNEKIREGYYLIN